LAQRLSYLFFDTGVMYRVITLLALEQGISMEDEDALGVLAETTEIDVQPPIGHDDARYYTVLVGSRDMTCPDCATTSYWPTRARCHGGA